jgi:parvulin-like peptidyl-prolyl isomerase
VMATQRKVGGYVDRQELNRAIQANQNARQVTAKMLEMVNERRGMGWLYPLLARLGQHLSTNLEALVEMERIRQKGEQEADHG